MAYSINGDCILCGLCADICPVNAIHGEEVAQTIDRYRYVIDEDVCVDCGECAAQCPARVIHSLCAS